MSTAFLHSVVRLKYTVTVLLLCSTCHVLTAKETCNEIDPCHCKTASGWELNLRPLVGEQPKPPRFDSIPGTPGVTYSYNPCNPYDDGGECIHVAACQKGAEVTYHYAVGLQEMVEFPEFSEDDEHPIVLTYHTNASNQVCSRTAKIILLYDSTATNAYVNGSVQESVDPKCIYTFNIVSNIRFTNTAPVVPSKGLSPGSILLIVFFVGIFVYLVGGILVLRYARGARGVEQIPNYTFWILVPGLIKDGFVFTCTSIGVCKRDVVYEKI
jgi:hypothetical protein